MACRTTSAKQRGYVVGCGDTLAYLTADITISGITFRHSWLKTQTIEMRLKPSLLQQCQQRTVRNRKSKKSRCLVRKMIREIGTTRANPERLVALWESYEQRKVERAA